MRKSTCAAAVLAWKSWRWRIAPRAAKTAALHRIIRLQSITPIHDREPAACTALRIVAPTGRPASGVSQVQRAKALEDTTALTWHPRMHTSRLYSHSGRVSLHNPASSACPLRLPSGAASAARQYAHTGRGSAIGRFSAMQRCLRTYRRSVDIRFASPKCQGVSAAASLLIHVNEVATQAVVSCD